jgi:hypothetical protein
LPALSHDAHTPDELASQNLDGAHHRPTVRAASMR